VLGIGAPDPEGRIPVAVSADDPRPPPKPGFVHRAEPHVDAAVPGGMVLPVVRTERLWLTALGEQHLDDLARLQFDPRVAEWYGGLPDPLPSPAVQREDAWRAMALHLGHWALRGHGQWALVERATGRFVGRAGTWQPEGWPGLEVGWMVDPDRWGEGLATEAGRAALDVAFDALHVEEVVAVTLPHNVRSRRVMEKVGLVDTGTTVDLRGHVQVLSRMTRADWLADVRPVPAWASGSDG
jgi:[ribosomal protein S5]-alanine N-acetyltransferase